LEFGPKWKVSGNNQAFVIQDMESSKVKDSKISFAAGSYLDLK
jgi:hypothetical protein